MSTQETAVQLEIQAVSARYKICTSLHETFNLDSNSIVFDIGGYKGWWSKKIYDRYGCTIHIFEPIMEYVLELRRLFADTPKVIIHPYAVSISAGRVPITKTGDTSSLSECPYAGTDWVDAVSFSDAYKLAGVTAVDLLEMNIEGHEYILLDHIIRSSVIATVKTLQVQFHRNSTTYVQEWLRLREALMQTHYNTFTFPFMWEEWVRL